MGPDLRLPDRHPRQAGLRPGRPAAHRGPVPLPDDTRGSDRGDPRPPRGNDRPRHVRGPDGRPGPPPDARKGKPDHNGTIRVACPASGHAPKVRCPLAEKSLQPHVITQPDGSKGDTRPLVQLLPTRLKDAAADHAQAEAEDRARADGADDKKIEAAGKAAARAARTDDVIPKVCGGSVSVKRETLVKHRQPTIYGSDDHKAILRAVRNSQEGFHGFAKDDAQEAIGAPGLRRKRGLPAQTLFAAIGLAVAAIRKIVSFLSHMQQDENGRYFVDRAPRPGSENLALGEGGGYQDDDADNWPADWLDDIPDAA